MADEARTAGEIRDETDPEDVEPDEPEDEEEEEEEDMEEIYRDAVFGQVLAMTNISDSEGQIAPRTKPPIKIFNDNATYAEWCSQMGLDPKDEENHFSWAEMRSSYL